ncbi:recombinase RecT [Synechococcus sp. HJ21-Hayes]|uniref:recombinase RecT n=1 Tax=unclassified Synechococcus TaxID=2626047 RepID=UPI0020CE9D63|nr:MULTISPECIES: recombinase RecT [unclassified Synechococcus]MCP9831426.1 recombinase RecT [Synechococcus sp. JJ3a-Johnson]MCP9851683.1 recombinase RecT [Synechococcus sp. HJ21-Hayes]
MNDSTLSTSSGPSPSSALAPATDTLQVFSGIAAFDAAQRMAKALCSSTLVPKEYQGQQGLANSLIALEIAGRMRLSPLVVMQNMTPIHGRPTWSSKFLIATVNASGRFSPLRFVFDAKEQPSSCYAVATDKATGEVLEGETITLELARKEGWWSRKDRQGNETSKWQTMTGQMLRYRAAVWWSNVYCPEIALGLITQEEALDIEAVTVREAGRASITGAEIQAPLQAAATLGQAAEKPAGPAATAPEKTTARRTAASPRAAAVPNPLRPREDKMIPPETQNSATGRIEPSHGGSAEADQEVIDAEIVSTSGAAPEPATPAEHQGEQQTGQQEALSLQASENPAAANQPAPRRSRSQAAAASAPSQAPAQEAAPAPEPELNPVEVGLRQIPHIATVLELERAYGRVNQLLSAGQINDENAERLWSAISRRRRQLEDSESTQQSAGAGT